MIAGADLGAGVGCRCADLKQDLQLSWHDLYVYPLCGFYRFSVILSIVSFAREFNFKAFALINVNAWVCDMGAFEDTRKDPK